MKVGTAHAFPTLRSNDIYIYIKYNEGAIFYIAPSFNLIPLPFSLAAAAVT